MNRFQVSQAQRELDHATLQLVSDIRWMQQMSANDATPRMAVIAGTKPLTYSYRLNLWKTGTAPQANVTPNGYRVLHNSEVLKEVKFDSDHVKATIKTPKSPAPQNLRSTANPLDITYYSYDMDYTPDGTIDNLENLPFWIQLTHPNCSLPMYVVVDSRVGRVLTTTDVNKGPL